MFTVHPVSKNFKIAQNRESELKSVYRWIMKYEILIFIVILKFTKVCILCTVFKKDNVFTFHID